VLNICLVGHGTMGVWHSTALEGTDTRLPTVVGRKLTAMRVPHGVRERWDARRSKQIIPGRPVM
jgi:hypothetical protein